MSRRGFFSSFSMLWMIVIMVLTLVIFSYIYFAQHDSLKTRAVTSDGTIYWEGGFLALSLPEQPIPHNGEVKPLREWLQTVDLNNPVEMELIGLELSRYLERTHMVTFAEKNEEVTQDRFVSIFVIHDDDLRTCTSTVCMEERADPVEYICGFRERFRDPCGDGAHPRRTELQKTIRGLDTLTERVHAIRSDFDYMHLNYVLISRGDNQVLLGVLST